MSRPHEVRLLAADTDYLLTGGHHEGAARLLVTPQSLSGGADLRFPFSFRARLAGSEEPYQPVAYEDALTKQMVLPGTEIVAVDGLYAVECEGQEIVAHTGTEDVLVVGPVQLYCRVVSA